MECNYCFGEINSRAQKCKHCGEWVSKKRPVEKDNEGIVENFINSKDLNQTVNSGIKIYAGYQVVAGIIGIIIFIVVLFFILGTKSEMEERHNKAFPGFHQQHKSQIKYQELPPEVQQIIDNQ